MIRPVLAALLATCLVAPALARDVSGSLAYRERIALPPGAELLVVLNGPGGPVAETRGEAAGEVPLPFALTVEETGPLTLRAAIFSGGTPVWVTAEIPVPEGKAAVDLGQIDLNRHVPLGFATTMLCGDRLVEVGFAGEAARLRAGARVIDLAPEAAASGAKFGDGAGNSFWSRGNRATVTLDGADLPECVPVIAPTLPLVARGNEPGWVVTLAHEGLVYSGQDGTRRELPLPQATQTEADTTFDTGEGLAITVTEALCRDSMTGMPYPYSVAALVEGADLQGCGGDPRALLAGAWRLVDLPGTALPDGAEVTFEVRGERIAGKAGCNRYTGGLSVTGETLTLAPGGVTMMACPDPLMQLEQTYLDLLARVSLFDIDEAGRLVLIVDGAPGAIFAR
jgi:heat shock protein HslJ